MITHTKPEPSVATEPTQLTNPTPTELSQQRLKGVKTPFAGGIRIEPDPL